METKIQILNIYGNILFEVTQEDNTLLKVVQKAMVDGANLSYANLRDANLSYANLRGADLRDANLSYANLRGANLSYANLSYADLSYANLRGAHLSGANLSGANLSGANLSGANLSGADLRERYIQVARIGSRGGMTTYCFDKDIIWCGCFGGTLEEFTNKVNLTHKDNPQFLKEYLGLINYINSLK